MDISTKTVTTRVHSAVATPESLKTVAIAAVKNQLGLADTAVVSASASVGTDGSIAVEVVESMADVLADAAEVVPVPVSPIASGLVIPTA